MQPSVLQDHEHLMIRTPLTVSNRTLEIGLVCISDSDTPQAIPMAHCPITIPALSFLGCVNLQEFETYRLRLKQTKATHSAEWLQTEVCARNASTAQLVLDIWKDQGQPCEPTVNQHVIS